MDRDLNSLDTIIKFRERELADATHRVENYGKRREGGPAGWPITEGVPLSSWLRRVDHLTEEITELRCRMAEMREASGVAQ